jgi:3-hydroxyisobutyrate dehydrogenase
MRAGHELSVWNRSPDKAAPLVEAGAKLAATPRAAAANSTAAFAMVSDDDASRALWFGPMGMLEALTPGSLAIECSTLSHAWVMELSSAAAAKGVRFLDCPVTGLPDAAARGDLTLLLGADPDEFERVRPLLIPNSKEIIADS